MSLHPVITLGILEDDEDTRLALEEHFVALPDFQVLFSCALVSEASAAIQTHEPDIALIDIRLPDGSGLDFIKLFRERTNGRALILTVLGDRATVLLAFEFGASGYLLKDTPLEQIARDIRALVAGGTPISAGAATHLLSLIAGAGSKSQPEPSHNILTAREIDVLTMFSRGLSYKETATALQMSAHTVADHVKSIYTKMQVHSRNEAIFEAVQNGWLEL